MTNVSKATLLFKSLFAVYIAVWLAGAVHEIGHVVIGSMTSYRISGIIIGGAPLSPHQITATVETEYGLPGLQLGPYIGNSKTLIQRGVQVPTRNEYLALLAGGSLANLLCVLLMYHLRGMQDFESIRDFLMCRRMPTFGALFLFINAHDVAAFFVPIYGNDGWKALNVLLTGEFPT